VAIIDNAGHHLAALTPVKVAVRGPNVIRGYRNNPEANAAAFTDGYSAPAPNCPDTSSPSTA